MCVLYCKIRGPGYSIRDRGNRDLSPGYLLDRQTDRQTIITSQQAHSFAFW